MSKLRAVFLLLAPLALATVAHGAPLQLRVGDATVDGTIGFTLMTTSNGDSLRVDLALGPMTASDKAVALGNAVAAQDPSGAWTTVVSGASLTFQHFVVNTWQDVDSITNVVDTTGAGTQLVTMGAVMDFNLGISPDAVASGVDMLGNPSFMTVSLTDTLAWTRPVQPGDTAQSLLDAFQAFLVGQAGSGVVVSRPSPTVIAIQLQYNISSFNWQITDTGLQMLATGSAQLVLPTAGVIDR